MVQKKQVLNIIVDILAGVALFIIICVSYASSYNKGVASVEPEKVIEYIEVEKVVEAEKQPTSNNLGVFELTAYCPCEKCCGKSDGITASGTKATAGRTIAAPKQFAFGTKLKINGKEYVVEDRGGAIQGNRIDIFFNTHQEALNFGRQRAEVFLIG